MEELVSIIVMTYKKFDYLKENIESICKQKYSNIEVIISDDGSPNFEKREIEKFFENRKENIKKIEILTREKNVGIVKNYNEAIKRSSGKYIIGLAADDEFYDENVVESIVDEFKKGANIVTGLRYVIDEKTEKFIKIIPKRKEIELFKYDTKKFLKQLFYRGNFIAGASTYYRKKYLEEIGYFDENYVLLEDFPLYIKSLKKGIKINFLNKIVIKYRLGGASTGEKINPIFKSDVERFYEYQSKEIAGFFGRVIAYELFRKKEYSKNLAKLKFLDVYIYLKFLKLLKRI